MKTRTFLLAAGLAALAPLSAFAKIERVVEKTFTVQPGGTLKVETSGGGIAVEPGPGDTVKVRSSTASLSPYRLDKFFVVIMGAFERS